jgi:hypothetical protein
MSYCENKLYYYERFREIRKQWPMSSERDSFAKGIFSTFAKGFLLHKLLLKVNFSPLRVKKSRSHDMGHCSHDSFTATRGSYARFKNQAARRVFHAVIVFKTLQV